MLKKKYLLRIVRYKNIFIIDFNKKIQARGSYLCKSMDCLKKAKKRRGFERSFSDKKASIIYDLIKNEVLI
jgi:predicted RNA-binding protein YlxR (DUF448 family)